jgi:hypothetical protein
MPDKFQVEAIRWLWLTIGELAMGTQSKIITQTHYLSCFLFAENFRKIQI